MNDEIKFKLELIVKQYSHRTMIDEELIDKKIREYYTDFYDKMPDENLSLVYSIKKLGKFCSDY